MKYPVTTVVSTLLLSNFLSMNGSSSPATTLVDAFVVMPSYSDRMQRKTKRIEPGGKTSSTTAVNVFPDGLLGSIPIVSSLGDTTSPLIGIAVDTGSFLDPSSPIFSSWQLLLGGGAVLVAILAFLPLVLATTAEQNKAQLQSKPEMNEEGIEESSSRRQRQRQRRTLKRAFTEQPEAVGVGRRGTLMTMVGGAMSFAASDLLLGAAGNVLTGGKAAIQSSVYGAEWNALFRRVASFSAKHGTSIASPELLKWISRSPAAFANPELRAWVAAQRAFQKVKAAAALEEGMAAASAIAAATVASQRKVSTKNASEDTESNASGESSAIETVLESATTTETEVETSLPSPPLMTVQEDIEVEEGGGPTSTD